MTGDCGYTPEEHAAMLAVDAVPGQGNCVTPWEANDVETVRLALDVCAPLCGASKAYGRFDAPWKHEPECPVRQAWRALQAGASTPPEHGSAEATP